MKPRNTPLIRYEPPGIPGLSVDSLEVPFRARFQNNFERLKAELLRARLIENDLPGFAAQIRRAANEAAAAALDSGFPELVFPVLFEERTTAEKKRALFQGRTRIRTRPFGSFPLLQS